jgi:hypothetical protein
MKRSLILWLIAFILTLLLAGYQRVTGPTYPVSGSVNFNNKKIEYELDRNHSGEGNHIVQVSIHNYDIKGELIWKRYKTNDDWNIVKMDNNDGVLSAELPHQPKAGKLLYKIKLIGEFENLIIPEQPVIIRFKGAVPLYILIPHILFIFSAMMLSARTGLEIFNKEPAYKNLAMFTLLFLLIGGGILGPIAQYYAFDAYWTGFPVGYDLTDNKILIAVIGWLIAFVMIRKTQNPKRWVAFASLLLFVVFLIPHSVLGSEFDYSKLEKQQKKNEKMIEPLK